MTQDVDNDIEFLIFVAKRFEKVLDVKNFINKYEKLIVSKNFIYSEELCENAHYDFNQLY